MPIYRSSCTSGVTRSALKVKFPDEVLGLYSCPFDYQKLVRINPTRFPAAFPEGAPHSCSSCGFSFPGSIFSDRSSVAKEMEGFVNHYLKELGNLFDYLPMPQRAMRKLLR